MNSPNVKGIGEWNFTRSIEHEAIREHQAHNGQTCTAQACYPRQESSFGERGEQTQEQAHEASYGDNQVCDDYRVHTAPCCPSKHHADNWEGRGQRHRRPQQAKDHTFPSRSAHVSEFRATKRAHAPRWK